MTRYFATMLLSTVLLTIAPRLAAADVTYDTVDAVQPNNDTIIQVTGIRSGDGEPSTVVYSFFDNTLTERCVRFALLAMSKPGKFQLVIAVSNTIRTCRLVVRTP